MSDYDHQPYVIVEKHGTGITAFFLGAFVGAATALLLAPKSGRETQQELREGARRLREGAEDRFTELRRDVEDGVEKARGEIGERVDTARENIRDRRHRAEEALKAGKDAAKRARSDLEQRVAESKAAYKAALDDGGEPSGDGADAGSKEDEKEEAEASS